MDQQHSNAAVADTPAGWEEVPATGSTPAGFEDIPAGWEPVDTGTPAANKGVKVVGKNAAGQSIFAPEAETPGTLRALWRATKTRVQPGAYFSGGGAAGAADQALTSVHNVGARAMQDLEGMARHPVDSALGMFAVAKDLMWDEPREGFGGPKAHGPIEQRIEEFQRDYAVDPRKAIENAAGDVLGLYMSGKLIEGVGEGAKRIPSVAGKVNAAIPASVKPYLPPVGRAVEGVKKVVTDKLPKGLINQLIRPSAADMKFGKNPAQAILDEGITGNSLPELGDRVYQKLQTVGRQIDQQARLPQNAGKIVDVTPSLRPFDDAIREAINAGDVGLFDRLNNLKMELTNNWKSVTDPVTGKTTMQIVGPRNLRMSPEAALKFKRMVGDRVRWTGNDPFENAVNEAAIKTYGGIKDAVNAKVDGLKGLNERYANLVGAAKAIERRIPVAQRNAYWSLSDITLGATGHIPTAVARKIFRSPAATTRVASGLYNLGQPGGPPTPMSFRGPAGMGAAHVTSAHRDEKKPPAPTPAQPAGAPAAPPDAGNAASPFARAISTAEGFGSTGTIPTKANNPGALELGDVGHGTMEAANGQKITIFGSLQEGWNALGKQLELIASGKSSHYSPSMTLQEFGEIYSNGDTGYGARVAAALGVDPSTPLDRLVPPPQKTALPLPQAKTQASAIKPTPSKLAPAPKKYAYLYGDPGSGHQIGSDDGQHWFDLGTGAEVK